MTISNEELTSLVDWESGLVSSRIFIDEEIYKLEQERIFGRTWLFLAHDSMIAKPGDFFSTYMGGDPVLVVRQKDGSVKAFLNVCRHRGMLVCRAEEGNLKAFMCAYHGWTYDTAGDLVSVPYEQEVYHGDLDKSKWGLVEIRTEVYKGLIFGNFDKTAPDLIEFLGDMTYYIDGWADSTEGGIEVLPGTIKWTINGNWKIAAEQFAGDGYHAAVTHASSLGLVVDYDPGEDNAAGRLVASRQGHGQAFYSESAPAEAAGLSHAESNAYLDARPEAIAKHLGHNRPISGNFNIFPNFSGLGNVSAVPATSARTTLRMWHPKGPNKFEIWIFTAVDKAMPEELKAELARGFSMTDGAAGIVEVDDGENWNYMGTILSDGYQSRNIMWNYQMGINKEIAEHPQWPGRIMEQGFGELPQRQMYRRWLEFMTSEEWPRVDSDPRAAELAQRSRTADSAPAETPTAADATGEVTTASV